MQVVWPSSLAITAERHAEDCGCEPPCEAREELPTVSGDELELKSLRGRRCGAGEELVSNRISFGSARGFAPPPQPFRPHSSDFIDPFQGRFSNQSVSCPPAVRKVGRRPSFRDQPCVRIRERAEGEGGLRGRGRMSEVRSGRLPLSRII